MHLLLVLLTAGGSRAEVTSAPVAFADAFDGPLGDQWQPQGADWTVDGGRLLGRGTGDVIFGGASFRDVEASVTVAIPAADGLPYWAGIRLRTDAVKSPGSGYLVYLRRSGEIEIWTAGEVLAARQTGLSERLARGEAVRLGARATGSRLAGLIDGQVVVEAEHSGVRWGDLALSVCGVTGIFGDFECRGVPAAGMLHGQVLNWADQLPVPGAVVETYHSLDGYPSLALASTHADADGRYLLEGLPPGDKAYWLRATKAGLGGGTGWFVSVGTRPTETDLLLLDRPPGMWIDSASVSLPTGWEHVADPQCYGGSRATVRTPLPADPPTLTCPFEAPANGAYVLHIASGLYEKLHYWSPYAWRVDGGQWRAAAGSLAFESPRYGDRATFVWARTEPLRLAGGAHRLEFRLTAPGPTGAYYWPFDALAVEQLPEPVGPDCVTVATPRLRWRGPEGQEVVLQLSSTPDFSDGTLTVPHLTGTRWRVPGALQLADGDYWWRLKRHAPEDSYVLGAFGPARRLRIATGGPAMADVRDRSVDPHCATIAWRTTRDCASWLEWDTRTFEPRFRTTRHWGRLHSVALRGLEPLTCHRYWVVVETPEGQRRTLRHQFLTPRRELAGRQSPFGIFGQAIPYAQEFADAGIEWDSDYWEWAALEPRRGAFDWTQAEERMARAEAAGLNLTVTFWGTPAWIRPSVTAPAGWAYTYGPEDPAATREFLRAVAGHCRGRTDWFLPWIEPNVARDPVFGYPRGYWASRPHAETYAAHERAAYRGAKTGNPDCRLVGMNTAGVDLRFIEKCYDEGAAEAFDVMNVHYYAMTGDFEKQDPEAQFGALRALMAQYGDAEKPVMCSEGGGASSGLPGTDEPSQAANLVRIYVISIANHIDKLCWTFSHDTQPYGGKKTEMVMWMGLFGFDPDPSHTPPNLHGPAKPSYFAYRNMTQVLAGSVFERRLDLGTGIRAYRFRRQAPTGAERITVAWSEEGERSIGLGLAGRLQACADYLGAPAAAEPRGSSLSLALSPCPLFVVESAE